MPINTCSESKWKVRWQSVVLDWNGQDKYDTETLEEQELVLGPSAAAAKSCPTLCDPIDGSPPGFPIPGILLARTLEWVAISFSNAWKWKVKVKSLSRVRLLATPWTAAYQAPLSMGFSRQEYWSGVPLPSPTRALSGMKKKKRHDMVKIVIFILFTYVCISVLGGCEFISWLYQERIQINATDKNPTCLLIKLSANWELKETYFNLIKTSTKILLLT